MLPSSTLKVAKFCSPISELHHTHVTAGGSTDGLVEPLAF